jgi:branched-chain amino acid aminotransferase
MYWIYLNGKVVPEQEALVSVMDRGFVLGDGLFETLRSRRHIPEFLKRHYKRMAEAAKSLKIKFPVAKDELEQIIAELTKRNQLEDAVVRIVLTRGKYKGVLSIDSREDPTLVVTTNPVRHFQKEMYEKGVNVWISGYYKAPESPQGKVVKSTNYLINIMAKAEADQHGAYEAVLRGPKGEMLELTTASFFLVKQGQIYTTALSSGILPGITRSVILEILKKKGILCIEDTFYPEDLAGFDEAFLTSSVRGVMPINKMGKVTFGVPGVMTKQIMMWYERFCDSDIKKRINSQKKD